MKKKNERIWMLCVVTPCVRVKVNLFEYHFFFSLFAHIFSRKQIEIANHILILRLFELKVKCNEPSFPELVNTQQSYGKKLVTRSSIRNKFFRYDIIIVILLNGLTNNSNIYYYLFISN